MRIVLAACGTRGDVQPALALATALMKTGCDIMVAAPPENQAWVESYGCPFTPFGSDFSKFISRYPEGHGLRLALGFGRFIRRETELQLEQLPRVLSGGDLVISFSLIFSAKSVSEALGVPCLWTATTPQLFPSSRHPPFSIKNNSLPPWLNRLAWFQADKSTDVLLKGVLNRGRKKLGLSPIATVSSHILDGTTLVASDPEIAPIPSDVRGDYLQTGCYIIEPREQLSDELESFLAAGPPPVYVGFGSMAERGPRMTALVYRALARTGKRLVLASGWGGLGGRRDDDSCITIAGAPHSLLFPRMAAVVHHGGAGTTAAAARAGMPQVVVPHIFDQFYWGRRTFQLGLGPKPIPQSRLTPENLSEAIREALNNGSFSAKAGELAERLKGSDGVGKTIQFIKEKYGMA
ncbi:MAG: glycosyltransferase [Pseudomonadota bacterium]